MQQNIPGTINKSTEKEFNAFCIICIVLYFFFFFKYVRNFLSIVGQSLSHSNPNLILSPERCTHLTRAHSLTLENDSLSFK